MINEDKLKAFKESLPENPEPLPWTSILKAESLGTMERIERATKMACGQFNYWEGKHGDIIWPGVSSEDWTAVVLGEKDIEEMNLVQTRKRILEATEQYLKDNLASPQVINRDWWWRGLTFAFGGDPLRKRETLLWMMLRGMGFDPPIVQCGCIDYNVIVALRKHGIIEGFKGNMFDLLSETQLRYECLQAIGRLLDSNSLTISGLDALLYGEGRSIRKTEPDWEDYFCYRPGCYFY